MLDEDEMTPMASPQPPPPQWAAELTGLRKEVGELRELLRETLRHTATTTSRLPIAPHHIP